MNDSELSKAGKAAGELISENKRQIIEQERILQELQRIQEKALKQARMQRFGVNL